jgi:hypothetical protein
MAILYLWTKVGHLSIRCSGWYYYIITTVTKIKVNESVVSVDHHKKLSISIHTSADVCNDMDNNFEMDNNLDRLGFASSHLTYSISGELFGHDYRRQLPYHQLI